MGFCIAAIKIGLGLSKYYRWGIGSDLDGRGFAPRGQPFPLLPIKLILRTCCYHATRDGSTERLFAHNIHAQTAPVPLPCLSCGRPKA